MTPQAPELLPCPLCSGAVQFRKALWPTDGNVDAIIHVAPTKCGMVEFSDGTIDESIIVKWNTRPTPAERGDPQVREALEKAEEIAQLVSEYDVRNSDWAFRKGVIYQCIGDLRRALTARPSDAAVAWQARDKVRGGTWIDVPAHRANANPDFEYRPLYALPPDEPAEALLIAEYVPQLIKLDDPARIEYVTHDKAVIYNPVPDASGVTRFSYLTDVETRKVIGFQLLLPTAPKPIPRIGEQITFDPRAAGFTLCDEPARVTPSTVGGEARISFRRSWIKGICDGLFAMGKLPSGALGSWAFLFREQLKDALEESPTIASEKEPVQAHSGASERVCDHPVMEKGAEPLWLVDWVYLYALEGRAWLGIDTAKILIALAADRRPMRADADHFKRGGKLRELAALSAGQVIANPANLLRSQPEPASEKECGKAVGENVLLRVVVDWAYLHATEGEQWPSTKTADELIRKALQRAPQQSDADAMKRAAPPAASLIAKEEGE